MVSRDHFMTHGTAYNITQITLVGARQLKHSATFILHLMLTPLPAMS